MEATRLAKQSWKLGKLTAKKSANSDLLINLPLFVSMKLVMK